jgi:hypothetical protein
LAARLCCCRITRFCLFGLRDLKASGKREDPADQLDSLVAPIALYPDNLLSQTLVASTYPLEIIQLQQWLDKNQDLAQSAEVSGSG